MQTGKLVKKRPVSEVKIHTRQRKIYDFEEIQKLAESIRRTRGLLHPIVLNEADDSLIAGGRRIHAYLYLEEHYPDEGWGEIPFTYKGEVTSLDAKVMELEENIARLDLQWFERAAAIAEIDSLQREIAKEKGEEWNMRKTAEMVGVSLGTVSQSAQINEEVKANPKLKEEKTLVGALAKVKEKKTLDERKADLARKEKGLIKTVPAEILVGDSRELIRQQESESFDLVVTNFPFGVEFGYSGKMEKVYDDEENYIVDLVQDIVKESFRVLKDKSWFVGFFDLRKITYSNQAKEFFRAVMGSSLPQGEKEKLGALGKKALGLSYWLQDAGFSWVSLVPCIWAKPNKTQGNMGSPLGLKGLVSSYEAFVFAAKGEAILFRQGRQNLFTYDTLSPSERIFSMQMPVDLCEEVLSMTVMGGARVLDPFAGVGSFGEAALNKQCSFVGFELNEERASNGNMLLREHLYNQVKKEA